MCRGGVHICRLKRTVVRFPLLFSVDLNFALYGYKYRILIPVHLLNHPSRRPVLTRGAASYPPGLAALSCALTSLRGLRLARSPLAIASRRPRLAPNPGYCLPARSAAPLSPPTPRLLSVPSPPPSPPTGWAAASASDHLGSLLSVPRSLSLSVGWAGALGAAERAGRRNPQFGAERRPPATRQRGGGARRVDRGRGARPQFGRAAEPARSAARASSGHPPPHSVPALYLHSLLPVLTPGDPLLRPLGVVVDHLPL